MNTDLIVLLAPVACILPYYFAERFASPATRRPASRRTNVILSLALMNQCLAFALSAIALGPLVLLLAPIQIASIAEWSVPMPVSFALSLMLLDFSKYAEHRLQHAIPWLWRAHRLHHADNAVDALTSITHHPLELALSFFPTIIVAVIFDVPVIVLIAYGLIVAVHSPFTHLNIAIPEPAEKYLSWLIITPNFHRIHHSAISIEGNANFGNLFPFWDRLLSTSFRKRSTQAQPLKFGIADIQAPRFSSLAELLSHPFK